MKLMFCPQGGNPKSLSWSGLGHGGQKAFGQRAQQPLSRKQ